MRSSLLAATFLALTASAAAAQPVSGVYVGGAGGVGFLQDEQVSGAFVSPTDHGTARYNPGYVGLGSIGYGFGNGVRLELEGSLRGNDRDVAPGAAPGGSGKETKTGGMANALFDMDIGSPYIFPYLGVGAGYQSVHRDQHQPGIAGGTETINASEGAFGYQAMLGASLPIPGVVGLSATAEYRYLGLTGTRKYPGTITTGGVTTASFTRRTSDDENHQLLIGLRYAFNVTPPPAPAAAPAPMVAATPAAAPATSRSYLVFFDWDRADISDRTRAIIADAATASTKTATRIDVAGHTDKSGTPAYNQDLSLKRANNVAAELVRLGVPAASISISAFGDTHPLVPTGDGMREQQNRRVEIVLQ
jgi:OOP family OmpA-OmpF porin